MSQDLLAEFGDFAIQDTPSQNYTTTQTQPSLLQSNYNSNTYPAQTPNTQAQNQDENSWDDDDDFGDFEEPESEPPQSVQTTRTKAPTPPVKEVEPKPVPKPAPKPVPQSAPKPTPKSASQPAKKGSGPPVILKKATKASQLPSNHPMAGFADILFDADEYDELEDAEIVGSWGDEDDFGDFETSETPVVSSKAPKPSVPPSQPRTNKPSPATAPSLAVDLLGFDDPVETSSRTKPPSGSSSVSKTKVSTRKPPVTRPAAIPRQESVLSNDDAWDDFEISQPSQPKQPTPPQTNTPEESLQIRLPMDILGDLTTLPTTTGVAPSNTPLSPPVDLRARPHHPSPTIPSPPKLPPHHPKIPLTLTNSNKILPRQLHNPHPRPRPHPRRPQIPLEARQTSRPKHEHWARIFRPQRRHETHRPRQIRSRPRRHRSPSRIVCMA
jgi:hypothetical protein